ncbi:hypothetical protein HDV57DRAFT_332094 [Trichoderma longibrachiatum]|uniref:Uncharacterized protein n=1 Tax=Trichoderma citrinoviride TaxID=58853 RepID=A0A2T4AWB6_9HYPO|nr:hypothetical protein BBK36DRAFT_122253 [Trichoderma citrinoviride]PTB61341.1 hypothetical protein BBK36DRAFT_122253 [Trichoderma citrinoviride]
MTVLCIIFMLKRGQLLKCFNAKASFLNSDVKAFSNYSHVFHPFILVKQVYMLSTDRKGKKERNKTPQLRQVLTLVLGIDTKTSFKTNTTPTTTPSHTTKTHHRLSIPGAGGGPPAGNPGGGNECCPGGGTGMPGMPGKLGGGRPPGAAAAGAPGAPGGGKGGRPAGGGKGRPLGGIGGIPLGPGGKGGMPGMPMPRPPGGAVFV